MNRFRDGSCYEVSARQFYLKLNFKTALSLPFRRIRLGEIGAMIAEWLIQSSSWSSKVKFQMGDL